MRPDVVSPDPSVSRFFTFFDEKSFFNAKSFAGYRRLRLSAWLAMGCLVAAVLSFAAPALSAQQTNNGTYGSDEYPDQSGYASPDYHAPRDAYGNVISPPSPSDSRDWNDQSPSIQQEPQQEPEYGQPQQYGQPQYGQPQYGQPNGVPQNYPPPTYAPQNNLPPNDDPRDYAPQSSVPPNYDSGMNPAQGAPPQQNIEPLSAQQLEQLVAPIALYPDGLVAQVLAASTYPQQVADADQWRRGQGYGSQDQIVAGADAQPWDPSVKALTAFPQVLVQMDANLQWVTDLGNAYYNQPQDVLHAVQVMRRRAQAAGNLPSTSQESVAYDEGNIVLAPPNPGVVYVPQYNPWAVYGAPVAAYHGYSVLNAVGSVLGSAAVQFGWGIATAAFAHSPFGLLAWGLNWLTQSVLFNGSNYYSHSATVADWGFAHGGPRAIQHGGTFGTWANRSRGGAYGRWNGYRNSRATGFDLTPYRAGNNYAREREPQRYSNWQRSSNSYARASSNGFRSFRTTATRTPAYGRSSYGNSFAQRSSLNGNREMRYAGRTDRSPSNFGGMRQIGRTSRSSFEGRSFVGHSSGNFKQKDFSRAMKRESHSQAHFGGSRAPKNFASAKSFGHGHSGGHSHSGGGHGGKHHG